MGGYSIKHCSTEIVNNNSSIKETKYQSPFLEILRDVDSCTRWGKGNTGSDRKRTKTGRVFDTGIKNKLVH